MLRAELIKNLKWNYTFVENLKTKKTNRGGDSDRLDDVIAGCLDLADYLEPFAGTTPIDVWIDRKSERQTLFGEGKVNRRRCNACIELLTLVLSEFESRTWDQSNYPAGVLPVQETRTLSEAQLKALEAGRKQSKPENLRRTDDA